MPTSMYVHGHVRDPMCTIGVGILMIAVTRAVLGSL